MNTDGHKSEGIAKKPVVTQQVKDFFHKNLCSSVFICGFNCFFKDELPLPIRSGRTPAQFTAWPGGGAAHLSTE
jgi:hypothetical protein